MNIPAHSDEDLSNELSKLRTETVFIEAKDDLILKLCIQMSSHYLAFVGAPFMLVATGSSVEKTKLHHRLKGGDVDIMVIAHDPSIQECSLEYHREYQCFVKVNLSQENNLHGIVGGSFLPTSYLKNMVFIGGNLVQQLKLFLKYFFRDGVEGFELSESSVGLQFNNRFLPSTAVGESLTAILTNIFSSLDRNNAKEKGDTKVVLERAFTTLTDHFYDKTNSQYANTSANQQESDSLGTEDTFDKKTLCDIASSVLSKRQESTDIVPALAIAGWPCPATEWITRHRIWPDNAVVQSIVQQGVHIVAKPLPIEPDEDFDFRVSFSLAELKLAEVMNDTQRFTISIVKMCNKCEGRSGLVSYHIKTAMYWCSETKTTAFWKPKNLSRCVMTIVGFLLTCIKRRFFPHYFIPKMNLFAGFNAQDFQNMEDELREIYHNWFQIVLNFIDCDHISNNDLTGHADDSTLIHHQCLPQGCKCLPQGCMERKTAGKHLCKILIEQLQFQHNLRRPDLDTRKRHFSEVSRCRKAIESLGGQCDDFHNLCYELMRDSIDVVKPQLVETVAHLLSSYLKIKISK